MTSFQDQTTSPMPQLRAEAESSAHATRMRPELRTAANPQLAAVTRAAMASPQSSRATVASSLTHLCTVHAMKTIDRVAARAAAAAKGPQPSMPRPTLATGRR